MRIDAFNPVSKFVKGVQAGGRFIPADDILEVDLVRQWVQVVERDTDGKVMWRHDPLGNIEAVTSRVYAPFTMHVVSGERA